MLRLVLGRLTDVRAKNNIPGNNTSQGQKKNYAILVYPDDRGHLSPSTQICRSIILQ